MRKPQLSTILIGLTAGVAIAALGIAIATAISARNSANGLKHLTLNVCKESSLTARNVEASLLVLNGAGEIAARTGSDSSELRAYWRANLPALRQALHERQGDNAARQKLSDCLRVRDGIVLRQFGAHRRSGQTTSKTTAKTTTFSAPRSGSNVTTSAPTNAPTGSTPQSNPTRPSRGAPGRTGPTGATGQPGPASTPSPAQPPSSPPPTPGPGLPSIPTPKLPCIPLLQSC